MLRPDSNPWEETMDPRPAGLTREQHEYLLKPIAASRVGDHRGQSHVEAWDIRRHLTRIFGFTGWDLVTLECVIVHETGAEKNGRMGWTVVYRVQCRLIVKDQHGNVLGHWDDGATGDAINMPSVGDAHDFALKTAMSQALKRCAVNLGDQFGLSLYNKGEQGAVILRSLVTPLSTSGEDTEIAVEALAAAAATDAPVAPEDRAVRPVSPAPAGAEAQPAVTLHPTGPSPREILGGPDIPGAAKLYVKLANDGAFDRPGGEILRMSFVGNLCIAVEDMLAEDRPLTQAELDTITKAGTWTKTLGVPFGDSKRTLDQRLNAAYGKLAAVESAADETYLAQGFAGTGELTGVAK